ncbi:MAG: hypothetical protein KF722_17950, partial [Nitrospira sp.]|nr:hypothetical protein [Nitrospira sp.]
LIPCLGHPRQVRWHALRDGRASLDPQPATSSPPATRPTAPIPLSHLVLLFCMMRLPGSIDAPTDFHMGSLSH